MFYSVGIFKNGHHDKLYMILLGRIDKNALRTMSIALRPVSSFRFIAAVILRIFVPAGRCLCVLPINANNVFICRCLQQFCDANGNLTVRLTRKNNHQF